MEIGIVPTKYGYAAVAAHQSLFDGEELTIHSPVPLPDDLKVQLLGQFSDEAARYLWAVGRWEHIGLTALVWAALGVAAIAVSSLWAYGWQLIVLYGWVRLWFLGDGIWLLLQFLARIPHRRRAQRLRRLCRAHPRVMIQPRWPRLDAVNSALAEVECLRDLSERFPALAPFYAQMLRIEPPALLERQPLSAGGRIRNLLLGYPLRLPRMIWYVGEL